MVKPTLDGKISPFCTVSGFEMQMGNILLMLHEALKLLPETWTQSPRWAADPTPEMIEAEKKYLATAARAKAKITELATGIHVALTDHNPEETLNVLQELYEDFYEDYCLSDGSDGSPTSDSLCKAKKILQSTGRLEIEEDD